MESLRKTVELEAQVSMALLVLQTAPWLFRDVLCRVLSQRHRISSQGFHPWKRPQAQDQFQSWVALGSVAFDPSLSFVAMTATHVSVSYICFFLISGQHLENITVEPNMYAELCIPGNMHIHMLHECTLAQVQFSTNSLPFSSCREKD